MFGRGEKGENGKWGKKNGDDGKWRKENEEKNVISH